MLFRVPFLVQFLFKRRIWRGNDSNAVYLTFDDGPDKNTTPWVLALLKKEKIKATFFALEKTLSAIHLFLKISSRMVMLSATILTVTKEGQKLKRPPILIQFTKQKCFIPQNYFDHHMDE